MQGGYVYILANDRNTVLYTGVTSNLAKRLTEHREGAGSGFTKRYNVQKLVYVERHDDIVSAITREKQIKAGSRQRKVELIQSMNPQWRDLVDELL